MTEDEWKIVEEDLKIIGNPVKLRIDNYDIALRLGQIHKRNMVSQRM